MVNITQFVRNLCESTPGSTAYFSHGGVSFASLHEMIRVIALLERAGFNTLDLRIPYVGRSLSTLGDERFFLPLS